MRTLTTAEVEARREPERRETEARIHELNVLPDLGDVDLRAARALSNNFGSDFMLCQAVVGLLVRVQELEQKLAARE